MGFFLYFIGTWALFTLVLGVEAKALRLKGEHSITERHLQPFQGRRGRISVRGYRVMLPYQSHKLSITTTDMCHVQLSSQVFILCKMNTSCFVNRMTTHGHGL